MRFQYASGRQQLPFSSSNLALSAGGALTTQSIYLAIAGHNPAGVTLLSDRVLAEITDSNQLQITFPNPAAGEFFSEYVLAGSLTNTASSFVQLAKVRVRANGNTVSLPITLLLDDDEHLALSASVATSDDLPINPVHGMLRQVTDLDGKIFEYDEFSNLESNTLTVLAASVGAWVWKPGNFSAYVANTTDGGGCDRPLHLVTATPLRAPRYQPTNSPGQERIYWIVNDDAESVPSGKRIVGTVDVAGVPQDHRWDNLLKWKLLGFSNIATGALRSTYESGETFVDYNIEKDYEAGKTDFIVPDDLQPGEALAFSVYPNFSAVELNNEVANQGVVRFGFQILSQAGYYVETAAALGNWIYPVEDKGWVVPQAGLLGKVLRRSGMVRSGTGGRSFPSVGPTLLAGLSASTTNQKAAINGNGAVYVVTSIEPGETLRAIISTDSGTSDPCPWSDPVAVSGSQGLTITCTYPSNGTTATIRSNYPDESIAGLTGKAQLNAPFVTLYVEAGGVIKRFTDLPLVDGATQIFEIDDWTTGETIAELPIVAEDFSCFAPVSNTAIAEGVGDIPAGEVRVCFAFQYDGTTISAISHDPALGCIHVATLTLAEMEYQLRNMLTLDDIIPLILALGG